MGQEHRTESLCLEVHKTGIKSAVLPAVHSSIYGQVLQTERFGSRTDVSKGANPRLCTRAGKDLNEGQLLSRARTGTLPHPVAECRQVTSASTPSADVVDGAQSGTRSMVLRPEVMGQVEDLSAPVHTAGLDRGSAHGSKAARIPDHSGLQGIRPRGLGGFLHPAIRMSQSTGPSRVRQACRSPGPVPWIQ